MTPEQIAISIVQFVILGIFGALAGLILASILKMAKEIGIFISGGTALGIILCIALKVSGMI